MKFLKNLSLWFVLIGALNWGFIATFNFNLVETILGFGTTLTMVAYILVGLSAVWQIWGIIRKKI